MAVIGVESRIVPAPLRENAPVYWHEAGQVWGITLYEDVFTLAKDNQTWRSSGGIRRDR